MAKKILFFIETLRSGGKERRFIELLYFFKNNTDFEMQVVVMSEEIHYDYIFDLGIPITIMKRKYLKYDPSIFARFFSVVKKFKPNIIHSWGNMTTFYALPAKWFKKKVLISNLVANTDKRFGTISIDNLFFQLNCIFSDKVLSNSKKGLAAYNLNGEKYGVIYNGVRLERFNKAFNSIEIRNKIGINTDYTVIMVASFLKNKNYDLLLDVAKRVQSYFANVTFIAVGDGPLYNYINDRIANEKINNVLLLGQQKNVEQLIYSSDIGVLFTKSEGISNSILEYMALGKPIVTNDLKGGTPEIFAEEIAGFILDNDVAEISNKLIELLKNKKMRLELGQIGKKIISRKFSLESMGNEYLSLYNKLFSN